MDLNNLKPKKGAKHAKKRVGRGPGSGHGKTAGRGEKGQKSRSGYSRMLGFEGGQMPLHRRLPKRGFKSLTRQDVAEVRLSDLQDMKATDIDFAALRAKHVVPREALSAKVILSGELKRKVTLKGVKASKGARAAIEAAGGKYEEPAAAPAPLKKLVAKVKKAKA